MLKHSASKGIQLKPLSTPVTFILEGSSVISLCPYLCIICRCRSLAEEGLACC